MSNSAPQRGAQDRAAAVATSILHVTFLHLQAHWTKQVPQLRDQIAATLRDEFSDIARMTRDDIRESE
jgi:hypothetical protein